MDLAGILLGGPKLDDATADVFAENLKDFELAGVQVLNPFAE